jgi:hypothetical protein
MRFPTSLQVIRRKVLAYHKKMNAIAEFLKANNAPPEILLDTSREYMEFYIEKDDLKRLHKISKLKGCDRLVVFFGLASPDNNSLTSCFLGIDKNYQILDQHRPTFRGGGTPGEDTWIPPGKAGVGSPTRSEDFTLATPEDTINQHLHD